MYDNLTHGVLSLNYVFLMRQRLSMSAMSQVAFVIDASEPAPVPIQRDGKGGAVVDSQLLFLGQREIWIEHEGERYRLRITRRGKLILQK